MKNLIEQLKELSKEEGIEAKRTSKSIEYKDGSSEDITIEEVEGGFIKTVCCRYKDENGEWQYEDKKSIHTENPLEEKSLADKLEEFIESKNKY